MNKSTLFENYDAPQVEVIEIEVEQTVLQGSPWYDENEWE